MISSIDPANTGATLLTQSSSSLLPQTTTTTQAATSNFLPISTQSTPSSLTDTLNGLMTVLQNLITSISSIFAGSPGSNNTSPSTVAPNTNRAGQFDFLRPVDEEPLMVLPPSTDKKGDNTIADSVAGIDDSAPEVSDSKQTKKAEPKKTSKKAALQKSNGEFLWKPKSDKDGKLAILLPKSLTGKVKGVQILSPDGKKTLAKGKQAGVGNGEREHFRFSKAGADFPDGAVVLITLKDGSQRTVKIKETSARTTR
jgi:hypothetical protein